MEDLTSLAKSYQTLLDIFSKFSNDMLAVTVKCMEAWDAETVHEDYSRCIVLHALLYTINNKAA